MTKMLHQDQWSPLHTFVPVYTCADTKCACKLLLSMQSALYDLYTSILGKRGRCNLSGFVLGESVLSVHSRPLRPDPCMMENAQEYSESLFTSYIV